MILLLSSPVCGAEDKVNLTADNVQYLREKQKIIAQGNTHLKTAEIELWADNLTIDVKNNKLLAEDNVRVEGDKQTLESERLEYDLALREGVFVNAESIVVDNSLNGELYLSSPKIDYGAEKSKLNSSTLTSCDYEQNHYEISSTSVVIYPGDKLIAYNNFLWEFNAKVPIFYSPLLIYSLKNDKQILEQQIGRSEIRGWFLKNTYNYTIEANNQGGVIDRLAGDVGQLYLDHFEKTGWAFGFKHYYHYREDRHAYLYLYTAEDKLNPNFGPWISAELDSYLREVNLTRRYNLNYQNHADNYFRHPDEITDFVFDFSQDNQFETWERELDFAYEKNESYLHQTDFELDFEGEISATEELEIDLDHFFAEDEFSYQNSIDREYGIDLAYERDLNEEYYEDKLELDLAYDYDNNRALLREYGLDLGIKQHFTEKHYYDYDYTYDRPLDRGVIEDNYLAEIDDEKTGHLHSLIFGKDREDDFYDWELRTKLFQQESQVGYYYLPEGQATLYPGVLWNNYYLNNLDISLGGANKYASSWGHKEQNGYYQLEYYDVLDAPLNNSLIVDQNFKQDYYSTGQRRWFNESRLVLNTGLFNGWHNEVSHNYTTVEGEVPDRFKQKDREHTLAERLEWRRKDSKFYVETGYDFLEKDYELLKSELNLAFRDYYQWDTILAYDLDEQRYEETRTNLAVDYPNFEYEAGLKLDLNRSEVTEFDTKLDWKFGPEEWQWHLILNGSYDNRTDELDKAEARIEKRLHCRRIALSYDHSSKEIWFQYEIFAFPQGKLEIGSNEEEGMLFEDDLGGILDDIEED